MTPKLSRALAAVEKLPHCRQDALADLLLDAAARATIDEAIAAGEVAEHGGRPAAEVLDRLIAKYAP